MDKRLQQASDWLKKEMEKDKKEIEIQKIQMIEEIKKLNKTDLFKPEKKVSIIDKILKILGYGKKR
jgi:uncharacterized protein (DUF849 family)